MKKQQLVHIPVDHICIHAQEYFNIKHDNYRQFMKCRELHSQIEDLNNRINELEVDQAASEAKVSDLEKELNEKQDRVLYWYQRYTELVDKLNAVKPDAKTKEA